MWWFKKFWVANVCSYEENNFWNLDLVFWIKWTTFIPNSAHGLQYILHVNTYNLDYITKIINCNFWSIYLDRLFFIQKYIFLKFIILNINNCMRQQKKRKCK